MTGTYLDQQEESIFSWETVTKHEVKITYRRLAFFAADPAYRKRDMTNQ